MNDYISKAEAIEWLKDAKDAGCVDMYSDGTRRENFDEAIETIESIPTADVQPVRHGRWTASSLERNSSCVKPHHLFCSECQHSSWRASKYCPNCGADMRGDNSEHE